MFAQIKFSQKTTTFAGDDLRLTRNAWDYSARGGNQSLPLLGIALPNPILLGTLLGENHQHNLCWEDSFRLGKQSQLRWGYGNLQACWGGTDLESAREMTLSNPLRKHRLSNTGRPSIRRTLVFTILPQCWLSTFENSQAHLDFSDPSHEDRIPGIHTNFPVLRLWRVFLIKPSRIVVVILHRPFIVRLSLAPGWTLWGSFVKRLHITTCQRMKISTSTCTRDC